MEASEIDVYQFEIGFRSLELSTALDRLESENGLTADGLMAFLHESDLFEPSTLDVVAVGVERYFGGDNVSALHILVPHLEDALRHCLVHLDIATTSYDRGLTREKPLDEVLATSELRNELGEDFASYLEVLLLKQRGDTLRHRTAHGLMKVADCTRERAQRVILAYLQLAKFRVRSSKTPAETPGTASH